MKADSPAHIRLDAVRPLLDILQSIADKPIELTPLGRITLRDALRLRTLVDPWHEWVRPVTEDADETVLATLVIVLTQLGLVRAKRRRLTLTKRGRRVSTRPGPMTRRLTAGVLFSSNEYERDVAYLLVVLTASGMVSSTKQLIELTAELAWVKGWRFGRASPDSTNTAYAASATLHLLRMAGRGDPSHPAAVSLARDMLHRAFG